MLYSNSKSDKKPLSGGHIGFFLIKIYFTLALLPLSGCTTYYIPLESFNEQFTGIDSAALITVKTRNPYGIIEELHANPIKEIYCIDKKGRRVILVNGPSIEIRFTDYNNKRTYFYFDKIFVQDSMVRGGISRFINYEKSIPVNTIKKIEVQDGRKKFRYVE